MSSETVDASTQTERAGRVPLTKAERQALRHFEPGRRALFLAAGVLVLLLGVALPWTGGATGVDILLGASDEALGIGVLPRIFVASVLLFGVAVTALTLIVRRWFLAWVCAFGCGHSVFEGMLAIWTRQTGVDTPGPGVGLVITVLAILFMAVQWFQLAWSRS
ncbi:MULTISPECIES: hypothetical protein [Actinoalloteichus]|uniref:Uncharacterized protein n=1 Tax=Actinoalloteichus fjordicus TaxID=1612552 RepID=A0AAC9LBF5_9PSEU|nr:MULTISPECIES: hypothetical protein [Actinoalloteichus]APU13785.1 hypothetical protein UA74_08595 [Actinoalloteichus fjordicus]APU19730.1 hypothetical protein UA75_08570 [Actinoalloteichus sp. GBA129-24]